MELIAQLNQRKKEIARKADLLCRERRRLEESLVQVRHDYQTLCDVHRDVERAIGMLTLLDERKLLAPAESPSPAEKAAPPAGTPPPARKPINGHARTVPARGQVSAARSQEPAGPPVNGTAHKEIF